MEHDAESPFDGRIDSAAWVRRFAVRPNLTGSMTTLRGGSPDQRLCQGIESLEYFEWIGTELRRCS
jgi:hypothetical protein